MTCAATAKNCAAVLPETFSQSLIADSLVDEGCGLQRLRVALFCR